MERVWNSYQNLFLQKIIIKVLNIVDFNMADFVALN